MTDAEVLQFFAGNCEAGYFRMVQHEATPALDFATGAVAAFAGTPKDYEMATSGVTFDVGTIPWIMDREDAVYWVDTSGMLFFNQGDERNAGAAAFAEYLLRDDVCSELLESVGKEAGDKGAGQIAHEVAPRRPGYFGKARSEI